MVCKGAVSGKPASSHTGFRAHTHTWKPKHSMQPCLTMPTRKLAHACAPPRSCMSAADCCPLDGMGQRPGTPQHAWARLASCWQWCKWEWMCCCCCCKTPRVHATTPPHTVWGRVSCCCCTGPRMQATTARHTHRECASVRRGA